MGTIYRNGVAFVGSGGAGGVEMTQSEYDALPSTEKMNGTIYFITDGDVSYPSASQMRYDNTESQIPATSVQGAIDENRIEINDLKSGVTWRRILNVETTANTNYDQTITTENFGNANEVMFTIQRKSNARTFASNVIPFPQFSGGALYASGSYTLYCGTMSANAYRWINAVAIFVSNTQIEIAVPPNDEALIVRVFVR